MVAGSMKACIYFSFKDKTHTEMAEVWHMTSLLFCVLAEKNQ
jgi:hypothetical protein